MDKKDRTIKDLKELNDKLQSQYYCSEARCFSAQYKAEQLEKENKQLKDNWNKLRDYLFNIRQRGFELQNLASIKNIEPSIGILMIIEKMDNIEKGDSNENN